MTGKHEEKDAAPAVGRGRPNAATAAAMVEARGSAQERFTTSEGLFDALQSTLGQEALSPSAGTVHFKLDLPLDLRKRFHAAAAAQGTTMSEVLVNAISTYVAAFESRER